MADVYHEMLGGLYFPLDGNSKTQRDHEQQDAETRQNGNVKAELQKLLEYPGDDGEPFVIPFEGDNHPMPGLQGPKTSAQKEDAFNEYCIVHRTMVSYTREREMVFSYRLELHSKALREKFRSIATPYRDIRLDTNPIIIKFPYWCLFFLKGDLESISMEKDIDPALKREIGVLLAFIESEDCHKTALEKFNDVKARNRVSFDMLWSLFPPNELVVAVSVGEDLSEGQGYLVDSVDLGHSSGPPVYDRLQHSRPQWEFKLLSMAHNGTDFKTYRKRLNVELFSGERTIGHDYLPLVPLKWLPDGDREKAARLITGRGERYIDLCLAGSSFLQYEGPATIPVNDPRIQLGPWGKVQKWTTVNERVIIDRLAESKLSPDKQTDEYKDAVSSRLKEYLNPQPSAPAAPKTNEAIWNQKEIFPDPSPYLIRRPSIIETPRKSDFTESERFICRREFGAFGLEQKVWLGNIRVSSTFLKDVVWKGDPYEQLQLQPDRKLFIRRLVEGFSDKNSIAYDDIIEGKGKGLIFLLYGQPGLGKTLTAESVAESCKRPLYQVSTGQLSTDVSKLEGQLTNIFQIGARWNAVVLLDEADVLMSKRTPHNLERNAVIAVFLRMLEYYKGILFLTTNRLDDFDEAFSNRVHVTIEYVALQQDWKSAIWKQHVLRATNPNELETPELPEHWTEEMFELLGQINCSGRNIKNYVRTACGIAGSETLRLQDVLTVFDNTMTINMSKEDQMKMGRERIIEQLNSLAEKSTRGPDKDSSAPSRI